MIFLRSLSVAGRAWHRDFGNRVIRPAATIRVEKLTFWLCCIKRPSVNMLFFAMLSDDVINMSSLQTPALPRRGGSSVCSLVSGLRTEFA